MIQLREEHLIALRDAPRHLPCRPDGKRVHISACYRWVSAGVRGVRLEALKLGGTTYTSLEALQRFAEQLTRDRSSAGAPREQLRSASQRRASAVAQRLELELGLPPGRLGGNSVSRTTMEHP